jgi:hypothetical protein
VTAVTLALSTGGRASGYRCQVTFALNAPAIWSVGAAIRSGLLLGEDRASGKPEVYSSLEGGLRRDGDPPGSAALARGWARARRDRVPRMDRSLTLVVPIRPLQLCADGGYQLRIRSLEGTPNYGP